MSDVFLNPMSVPGRVDILLFSFLTNVPGTWKTTRKNLDQQCARIRDNPILFTSTAQARQARDAVRRATLAKRKRGFTYQYLWLVCVKYDIINKKNDLARNNGREIVLARIEKR